MTEELRTILAPYGWDAEDTSVLISCCGDPVELDCEECPSCGAPNPLMLEGMI